MHRVAWAILKQANWLEKHKIDPNVLIKFMSEMEKRYNKRKNPFHNYQHGIAVMQGCYGLATGTRAKDVLSDFDQFVVTFSGYCHDVNHTGKQNQFETNSMSKLAIRYQDQSVLEQHHLATTFKILNYEQFNIFANMTHDTYIDLRKKMISNILYTDIKKHFTLLKDFENGYKAYDSVLEQAEEQKEQSSRFGQNVEEALLLTGMIIHTADFTGGAKPFPISRVWSERVNQEFAVQYEEEGKLGIPQTPFLKDLDKIHILAKGEIGFFKFIVMPLWSMMNQYLQGDIDKNIKHLENAVQEWGNIQKENTPEEENKDNQDKK